MVACGRRAEGTVRHSEMGWQLVEAGKESGGSVRQEFKNVFVYFGLEQRQVGGRSLSCSLWELGASSFGEVVLHLCLVGAPGCHLGTPLAWKRLGAHLAAGCVGVGGE